MSFVQVVVVKDEQCYVASMHFRAAMKLIQGDLSVLDSLKSKFVDAGYLIVDLNRKLLVNGQGAFAAQMVKSSLCVFET